MICWQASTKLCTQEPKDCVAFQDGSKYGCAKRPEVGSMKDDHGAGLRDPDRY
jgi:hypothetical protein